MRTLRLALLTAAAMLMLPAGTRDATGYSGTLATFEVARASDSIALPAPRLAGGMSLAEAIAGRRSVRAYLPDALSLDQVAQLLWAAQGITDSAHGRRAAPSAGALYPLETYLVAGAVDGLAPGLYRYRPTEHALTLIQAGDPRALLSQASYNQRAVREAPVLVCLSAVLARTEQKYGPKAERFAAQEAGHAAQNACLTAVALGLGALTVGGFDDDAVAAALGLPAGEIPLYLLPVGWAMARE